MTNELEMLFGAGSAGSSVHRSMTVLKRNGTPLLFLPLDRKRARCALSLYPAQRTPARCAVKLLRMFCSAGLARLLPTRTIEVRRDAPFPRFLLSVAPGKEVPDFAILAGNPNADGRRYIVLLFDADGTPSAIVKAGIGTKAINLIDREVAVLDQLPDRFPGLPRMRGSHRAEGVHALALDYINGSAPGADCGAKLGEVLGRWLDETRTIRAEAVPGWQRLVSACSEHPVFRAIRDRVESASLHPALSHGDFAPWNIKVTRATGEWTVLDWERGELEGLPCWDWFHFHIQTGILVDRLTAEDHARRIAVSIEAEDFRHYGERANAWNIRRELLLAYLLHAVEILRPTEGGPATGELLNTLAHQWTAA